jgi:hypothetical protein
MSFPEQERNILLISRSEMNFEIGTIYLELPFTEKQKKGF